MLRLFDDEIVTLKDINELFLPCFNGPIRIIPVKNALLARLHHSKRHNRLYDIVNALMQDDKIEKI